MVSVALVGGDGAGKTTLARRLEETFPLPIKYLYMGLSALQSKLALPTTYLISYIKVRSYQKKHGKRSDLSPGDLRLFRDYYYHNPTSRPRWWLVARNLNTLADLAYRLAISSIYQKRGFTVVYDRHFFFMNAPHNSDLQLQKQPWTNHWLHWVFTRFYPKPDLVFFLDASAEVLYERKMEGSIEDLYRQRQMIIEQSKKVPCFIPIDATKPADEILSDVTQQIMDYLSSSQAHK